MPPIIDQEKCVGCGVCADHCQMHVFYLAPENGQKPAVRYPDECWHCNACVMDCAADAISLRFPLPYMLLRVESAKLKPR